MNDEAFANLGESKETGNGGSMLGSNPFVKCKFQNDTDEKEH